MTTQDKCKPEQDNGLNRVSPRLLCDLKRNSTEATIEDLTKVSLEYTIDLIKCISDFKDEYSKKTLKVFKRFLEHKSFDLMKKELEPIEPEDEVPFHNRWNLNTRLYFLEVVYPTV